MVLELAHIQLPIIRNYGAEHGCYLFLAFQSAEQGRAWLGRMLDCISTAERRPEPRPACLSVAFSFAGLEVLGVPPNTLASFPQEFEEGMARRAEQLGLAGPSDPSHWELGGPSNPPVHAALFITAPTPEQRDAEVAVQRTLLAEVSGVDEICAMDGDTLPGWREHFGYVDGLSQPAIEGSDVEPIDPHVPKVAAGEFVLGYPDEEGEVSKQPEEWIATNGSFLAFQKIYQDVAAFRRFLDEAAAKLELDVETVAAKLMGRWRSGAPLALAPTGDNPALVLDPHARNAFSYQTTDSDGFTVPIGSHIRRMNPRDSLTDSMTNVQRHRVIRRGVPYGPPLPEGASDDGVDRGLMGFFFNASLSRQYEFIQQAWANDPKFNGLENDVDPIAGSHDGNGEFTIQHRPLRRRIQGLPRFTTVKAGAYFFMPGISALRALADGAAPTS